MNKIMQSNQLKYCSVNQGQLIKQYKVLKLRDIVSQICSIKFVTQPFPSSIYDPLVQERMQPFNCENDIMQDQAIRQARKVLKVFKQIQEEQSYQHTRHKTKKLGDLQSLRNQIRLQNMRSAFFKKLNRNNIYQQPQQEILLSKQQKDAKRLLKWKGYRISYQKYVMSIFHLTEMIFLILTYVLTSFMCCIHRFVQTQKQNSFIALGIILMSMMLCLAKIVYFSVSQKVHRGIVLEYISDIAINYVKTWVFYVDLVYLWISVFLFIEMVKASQIVTIERLSAYLFICTIVRIFASRDNLTIFRTTFITGFTKDQFYKLIKLTIFNCILAHFVASILLAMYFIDKNNNWIIAKNLDQQEWYVQYMWGFYWSTTIMTSVGFGDYSATSPQEAYVVAYLQLLSCIILAYNISEIGNIVYAMRLADQQYVARVAAFKRMAQKNQTNPELRTKIESYLREQKQIKQQFEYNQQSQIINSLPESLKKDFTLQSNNRVFRSLPFFKSLHKNTLIELAQAFVSKFQYPGQILVGANRYNQSLMILKQGSVGLVYNKMHSLMNGIVVQEIQQQRGDMMFGRTTDNQVIPVFLTVQFLSPGKVINYDISVVSYSVVSRIKTKVLMQIIKAHEMDSQYYFNTIHSHQANQRQWFQVVCQRCSKPQNSTRNKIKGIGLNHKTITKIYYHNKFNCPKLHYIPWKNVVIMKYIKTPGQAQQGISIFKRKKQKSESCLILRKRIFNKYETKRFINEKKRFQHFANKSQTYEQINLVRTRSRKQSRFTNLRRNTFSIERSTLLQKTSSVDPHFYEALNKDENEKANFVSTLTNHEQQVNFYDVESQQEQVKTIIEEAIKTTVNEITPKNISLTFWNLEIDILFNYRNYFPQNNSAYLDNFSLCQFQKLKRKKALTILGEVLKNISLNQPSKDEDFDLLQIQGFSFNKKSSLKNPMQSKYKFADNKQLYSPIFSLFKTQQNTQTQNLSNVRFEIDFDDIMTKNTFNHRPYSASEVIVEQKLNEAENSMNESNDS